jgi:hypothetical protein
MGFVLLFRSPMRILAALRDMVIRRRTLLVGRWRYSYAFSLASLGITALAVAVLTRNPEHTRRKLVIVFLFAAILFPLTAYTGSRSAFLAVFVPILLVYNKCVKRLTPLLLSSFAVVMFVIFAIFGQIRTIPTVTRGRSVSKALVLARKRVNTVDVLLSDFSRLDVSAIMIRFMDRRPGVFWGRTFLNAFPKVVPVSLGRRDLFTGTSILGAALYGPARAKYCSKACPLLGEAYANFHIPGIILAFLMSGFLFGALERAFIAASDPYRLLLIGYATMRAYALFTVSFDIWFTQTLYAAFAFAPLFFAARQQPGDSIAVYHDAEGDE